MAGLSRKNLERMLNDPKLSDITLVSSDGQEFHASTRILQTNCPYFMVAQNLEKAVNGRLALDIRGKILAEVRRWIYIKTIDVEAFEVKDLLDMLSIADSYGLEDLKEKARSCLNKYPISEENVLKILKQAEQVENRKLMNRCKDYLRENIESLLQNPQVFDEMPSDLILEMNQKVSLQKLPNYYAAIGNWARKSGEAVARKVFQETLNFKEMPKKMLVDIVEKSLLKDDDIITEQIIDTLTSEISQTSTCTASNRFPSKNEGVIRLMLPSFKPLK